MPDGPTPRQVARAQTTARIKELALAQLAESAATELSLRAIARELHIVSSGIYRYFEGRDALITALILEAYEDLAEHLESAPLRRRTARSRWVAVCDALREWAREAPHRFALIYGSAIPGYRAPQDTVPAAARVVAAFLAPLAGSDLSPRDDRPPAADLTPAMTSVRDGLELELDDLAILLGLRSFAQVVGLLTLELNGHLVGTFEPADALYADLVAREAHALGL